MLPLRPNQRRCFPLLLGFACSVALLMLSAPPAPAQTCQTDADLDAPTHSAIEAAANKYFALAAKGDAAALQQNSIPSVANAFSGIADAIHNHQLDFANAHATTRSLFQLTASGSAPIGRAEFLCGVFGKSGQTASSAVFVLNDLPPGAYAIAILDVKNVVKNDDAKSDTKTDAKNDPGKPVPNSDTTFTAAFILQQLDSAWKLAGFYVKPTTTAGHDSVWFTDRAHEFITKTQPHNAWFYLLEARNLATVVPFMSTRDTDRLYDESQKLPSPDAPEGFPPTLAAAGQTYKIKSLFAYGIAGELNLVLKYDYPDISNTVQAYAANQAVAKALVAKWPELRDGFGAVVARATDPVGKDFGTLVPMKDLH
jgi:hypothetical protein